MLYTQYSSSVLNIITGGYEHAILKALSIERDLNYSLRAIQLYYHLSHNKKVFLLEFITLITVSLSSTVLVFMGIPITLDGNNIPQQ